MIRDKKDLLALFIAYINKLRIKRETKIKDTKNK